MKRASQTVMKPFSLSLLFVARLFLLLGASIVCWSTRDSCEGGEREEEEREREIEEGERSHVRREAIDICHCFIEREEGLIEKRKEGAKIVRVS